MRFLPLLALAFAATPVAAQSADTLRLRGLHHPVEIVRDSAGINHIYARDEHDLFFAQGFAAARDRLFQFEVWRRRATGTFAEALGPAWVERDRAARLFRYRGDMARELAHYHPRGRQIVQAFVDGVNAWVARVERDPSLAPPELAAAGLTAGRWTPEIVVSRHNALSYTADEEVATAKAVSLLGADGYRRVVKLAPDPVDLDLAGIDVAALDPDILDPWNLWRSSPTFGDSLGRSASADVRRGEAPREGSNNWVIAGRRSASGKPLLANDPHRAIQVPSLRSYVHLVAPGWNVIGGGEPAIPGVAIGHNAHGAWGLTIFTLDQEDIVVYALDRADPERYRDGATWRRFRREVDTIRVKGASPAVVTHRFARHGPVLRVDTARSLAYAIRGTQFDVGAAPYLASLRIDQARTWGEFRQALSFHRMPALNWVWADTGGTIGWQVAGAAPIRRGYSGLLPAPADGRHEWDGRLPVLQLPHLANPALGAFGTANEMNVPAGYAHPEAVSRWWEQWRARRLAEVFADTTRRFTMGDMARLQHDETSVAAKRLVPLLRGITVTNDPLVERARAALLAWDHVMGARSVGAGIYAAWERQLSRSLHARVVPMEARRWVPTMELDYVVEAVESPDARFGADPAAGRDSLLLASFSTAVWSLRERFGDDVAGWQLGRPGYKHAAITHPASAAADSTLRARLDIGPVPRGGSGRTLNATGDSDRQRAGASFRIAVDLGDWDAALGTNTPGQSGDSRSPHYRDLFAPWAAGQYFAVPYSRAAVMKRAEEVTRLLPAALPAR